MKIIIDISISFILTYLSGFFLVYIIGDFFLSLPDGFGNAFGAFISVSTGASYLYYRYPIKKYVLVENIESTREVAVWGIAGGIALGVLNFPFSVFLSKKSITPIQIEIFNQDPVFIIISLIFVLLIIPIVEELFFRALIYKNVKNNFGIYWGYAVSSILFSIGHKLTLTTAISSLLLCYIYEKSGFIGSCIIAHALWNSIWYAAIYFNSM